MIMVASSDMMAVYDEWNGKIWKGRVEEQRRR